MALHICVHLRAGRREFGDFISDYTAPVPGHYVDVDTGRELGACANMLALTLGQGSGISGLGSRSARPLHAASKREAAFLII